MLLGCNNEVLYCIYLHGDVIYLRIRYLSIYLSVGIDTFVSLNNDSYAYECMLC